MLGKNFSSAASGLLAGYAELNVLAVGSYPLMSGH
jgi:hypothetical protein